MRSTRIMSWLGLFVVSALGQLYGRVARAASATTNLDVTGAVPENCTIQSTAVFFGSYDPLVVNRSAPLDGVGTLKVKCTLDSNASIMLGQGQYPSGASTDVVPLRRMSGATGEFLSYDIFLDAARATIWGNTAATGYVLTGTGLVADVIVYGRIPGGQTVAGGFYTDTVFAVVSF